MNPDQIDGDRLAGIYAAAMSGIRVHPNPQLRGNEQILLVSLELYEELMRRYGQPIDVEHDGK